jgi:hypothetical protein
MTNSRGGDQLTAPGGCWQKSSEHIIAQLDPKLIAGTSGALIDVFGLAVSQKQGFAPLRVDHNHSSESLQEHSLRV